MTRPPAGRGPAKDAPDAPELPREMVDAIVMRVETAFREAVPTIGVIGLSGVGKSSTINAMFGTNRKVSATTRGTYEFRSSTFSRTSERLEGVSVTCALRVYDAPGLGEDVDLDDNYLDRYRKYLKRCDIVLWILAARNRALALDQHYLERLANVLPHLVIGVNQCDLVEPLDWDERLNLPSRAQEAAIAEIVEDRQAKLARFAPNEPECVGYCARRYYNLQRLYLACLNAAPADRRWMFEMLKSFSTYDWLAGASGLTAKQRAMVAERYITADKPVPLSRFADAAGATR